MDRAAEVVHVRIRFHKDAWKDEHRRDSRIQILAGSLRGRFYSSELAPTRIWERLDSLESDGFRGELLLGIRQLTDADLAALKSWPGVDKGSVVALVPEQTLCA